MGHDSARSRYRAAVAVELRMAGAQYEDIAKELGYADKSGAWRAVQRSLKARTVSAVDRYRMVKYAELESLHHRELPSAMKGDLSAVNRLVQASGERVSLMGLR